MHHALIQLRIANADDFKTEAGQPKWNAVYFIQCATGMIERKAHYLTEASDKAEFKRLFDTGQIWVFGNPDEVTSIFNCIDWDLVNRELDDEIKKLEEVLNNTKAKGLPAVFEIVSKVNCSY